MKKTLPTWAFGVLSAVGAVLVGSMLLSWIDVGGAVQVRGFTIASDSHWLYLVPIAGVVLLVAAATRSGSTRLAALFAGVVVAGDVLLNVASSMVHGGLDSWLVLGGAGAMIAGASTKRVALRGLGGIAVLAGFFAPWAPISMFDVLTSGIFDAASVTGFTLRVLWLVPIAGVAGIASVIAKAHGGKLAALSGLAVYGALLWVIGTAAVLVFGIGAWAALGASLLALVIGVVARDPSTPVPAKLTSARDPVA